MDKTQLIENIQQIKQKISENKKNDQSVEMIAVTKYVDSDMIRALYDLGLRHFGENRSDELLEKQTELADINEEITWHFIGQLQRRPVRKIINKIAYLHSLDRISLIEEVNKRANHTVSSFLQVNVSEEEQKAGFKPDEVLDIVRKIEEYPNIKIVGLMMMAPYEANDVDLHRYFKALKLLQDEIIALNLTYAPCTRLSMGMTDDFPIAIQEGATDVRIGRALYME